MSRSQTSSSCPRNQNQDSLDTSSNRGEIRHNKQTTRDGTYGRNSKARKVASKSIKEVEEDQRRKKKTTHMYFV